jgi:hypothetical protein
VTHLNQPRALTPADRSAATSPTAEARKTHRRECESLDIISQKVNLFVDQTWTWNLERLCNFAPNLKKKV